MAATLGAFEFDGAHTRFSERLEEVGGRDARIIEVSGLIAGQSTVEAIEAALDAILAAASAEDYSAALSIRAGRRMWVRREAFKRTIEPDRLVGSFELRLAARDPFEEAETATEAAWAIGESGATIEGAGGGSADSPLAVLVTATGMLVNPSVGDGVRTIRYEGLVAAGQTLTFDGVSGKATLDGMDVTPYTAGLFPKLAPGATTLAYGGDPAGENTADAVVRWRARWW